MRVTTNDPSRLGDLLGFLREQRAIAYYLPADEALEVIVPTAFGDDELREIDALLARWRRDADADAVVLPDT